jgi:hypothetical protein
MRNASLAPLKGCGFVFGFSLFLFTSLLATAPHTMAADVEAPTATEDTLTIGSNDALSDDDMAAHRGGTETNTINVTSQQTLNTTSSGNTVNVNGNLSNGAITVGSNFGGSGFGSYVMNSGNNATISSGVSVSVLMLNGGPK